MLALAVTQFRVLSPRLSSKNINIKIYRTAILPLVLYGCETRSLTLNDEQRLRVSQNRVLGSKTVEVTEDWRKLHNEELHTLYSSLSTITMVKSNRMRWVG
jgi:hypothetical protein